MLVFSFIPLAFRLFLLFKTHLKWAKSHSRGSFSAQFPMRNRPPDFFIQPADTSIGVKSGCLLKYAGVGGVASGIWVFSSAVVTN